MAEASFPDKMFAYQGSFVKNDKEPAKQEQPKPPRSAFMCFVDAKKKELLESNDLPQKKKDVLKLVAGEWRKLSDKDRAFWDEEARNDKVRFVREKDLYKGEWIIPKRRAKKHPHAPKRPMSAFLKYSQVTRAKVKAANPKLSNTDISSLLGEMWNNAPHSERAPFLEKELKERNEYKQRVKEWREKQEKEDAAARASHQMVQHSHHPYSHERSSFDPYFQVHSVEDAGQKVDHSFPSYRMDDYAADPMYARYPHPAPAKASQREMYRAQENHLPPYRLQRQAGPALPFRAFATSGAPTRPTPDAAASSEQAVDTEREPYPTTSKYFDRPRHSPFGFYHYP